MNASAPHFKYRPEDLLLEEADARARSGYRDGLWNVIHTPPGTASYVVKGGRSLEHDAALQLRNKLLQERT